jgi:tRNA(Ile)-lysidine synthase
MLKVFLKYLTDTCQCLPDKKYLLAVSGGVDSVVMANLFQLSGIDFAIAHCNFRLRGDESDGDQQYVEELAAGFKKPCYIKDFDTISYSRDHGISIQMAARDLRYAWFETLAEKEAFDYIAVGHNQNDAVETVLLNFSRGCGIRGFAGINPHAGKVVRPLLFASREEILQFALDNNLPWHEDSSNAETKYHRNKIRHTIIPAFESINPAFRQNALETIRRMEQTGKLLDHTLDLVKSEVWTVLSDRFLIDIEKLKEYPSIEIILYELLRDFGINQISIKTLLDSFGSIPGKQFHTRTHCITRDRSHLIITQRIKSIDTEVIIDPETILIDYPVHLTFNLIPDKSDFIIPAGRNFAALDAERISFPLKLRNWKEGDRFRPLGLSGSKKISDFLINNKIALPDKKYIWILETAGKIAWVVNHRIDDRFKITAGTRKILVVEYKE